jgi:uncharacterized MAPEG superfamily protein
VKIPVIALLGFALWTLLILFVTIGPYRWLSIFAGKTKVSDWTADPNAGHGWYPRAMRAHLNCVENLPVFGAIVFAVQSAGVSSSLMDGLALTVLGARVLHTSVHIGLVQTDVVASVRFGFFFIQLMAMVAMGILVLVSL